VATLFLYRSFCKSPVSQQLSEVKQLSTFSHYSSFCRQESRMVTANC